MCCITQYITWSSSILAGARLSLGALYTVGIRYMESFDIIFFSYTLHGCVSVYLLDVPALYAHLREREEEEKNI